MMSTQPSQIYEETTGVCEGVLTEDFMVTARAVGKPYCSVAVPDLGWSDKSGNPFPLTFVPFQALAYGLKAGDKVRIAFRQNDTRYPYLWNQETPAPIPEDDSPQPGSSIVSFPSQSQDEYTFMILGPGLIVASNDTYGCIRFGDQAQYFSGSGIALYSDNGKIGFHAQTEVDIQVGANVKIKVTAGGALTIEGVTSTTLDGDLNVKGEVAAKFGLPAVVHLSTHAHLGVQTGGGTSGGPVPGS